MPRTTGPVLVVDDDADCRAFVTTLLEMLGFGVVIATDGEEGLALARMHRPCLILLDLMMPRVDGFTFREIQLRTPELADIPVVLISALQESQIRNRMGRVPAVAKPIDVDELITQVVAHCDAPRGEAR